MNRSEVDEIDDVVMDGLVGAIEAGINEGVFTFCQRLGR
jgi:hypothetical protein